MLGFSLKFSRRYDLERSYEALWLQVELNRKKYLFCCAYRAPDESLGIFGYLEDILHKATRENFEVIILGDLNCDCLKSELKQTERMYEFLMANELTQMIAEPTRVTSTSSSLIDVLITSTPNSFERTGVLSTSFSDHLPIYGVLWSCLRKYALRDTTDENLGRNIMHHLPIYGVLWSCLRKYALRDTTDENLGRNIMQMN